MKGLRRLLGVLVMVAGVLGLALSLAGLASIWALKPSITRSIEATITTLNGSINTSQQVMEITGQALGATVVSVDALSAMLGTTARTVEDTKPVMTQINLVMSDTLPASMEGAAASMKTAQEAAEVLESSMRSLDNFRRVLSATPMLGALVEKPEQTFNPDKPLADSLGELAMNLEDMQGSFAVMSENLDKADDNLELIQANLTTMADSVALISKNLGEYQAMIGESQASMENLKVMLNNLQSNLAGILNGASIVLSLFFLWLLAVQIVIFSQGWELYQGTAGRMEGGPARPAPDETAATP